MSERQTGIIAIIFEEHLRSDWLQWRSMYGHDFDCSGAVEVTEKMRYSDCLTMWSRFIDVCILNDYMSWASFFETTPTHSDKCLFLPCLTHVFVCITTQRFLPHWGRKLISSKFDPLLFPSLLFISIFHAYRISLPACVWPKAKRKMSTGDMLKLDHSPSSLI